MTRAAGGRSSRKINSKMRNPMKVNNRKPKNELNRPSKGTEKQASRNPKGVPKAHLGAGKSGVIPLARDEPSRSSYCGS